MNHSTTLAMKNQILLTSIFIFLSIFCLQANNGISVLPPVQKEFLSSIPPLISPIEELKGLKKSNPPKKKVKVTLDEERIGKSGFHFPEIDQQLEAMNLNSDFTDPSLDDMKDILEIVDSEKVKKARAVINHAMEVGNFISKLTGEDLVSLPLVMQKKMGNIDVRIVFNKMELTPTYAELEVFAGVIIPQKNGGKELELMFALDGIQFSYEGGFVGNVTLGLLSNIPFELGGAQKKAVVVLNQWEEGTGTDADTGTFVTIGCDGIEAFGIEADLVFTRKWILPTDEFGNEIEPSTQNPNPRVKAHFGTTVTDWNNMMFYDISIDHFVLTKFKDISFKIANANVDLSDYDNPPSVNFPDGYLDNFPADQPELWRGVYIEGIEITLPKPFKKNCSSYGDTGDIHGIPATDNAMEGLASAMLTRPNIDDYNFLQDEMMDSKGGPSPVFVLEREDIEVPESIKEQYEPIQVSSEGCRIKVGAENLFIDKEGVTGYFFIEGEAPILGGGRMDKAWGFSIDQLSINLYKSKVTGFGFGGQIAIPIAKQETPLQYSALINFNNPDNNSDDVYEFTASFGQDMKFPVFKAGEVTIEEASTLIVTVVDVPGTDDREFTVKAILYGEMHIGAMDEDSKANIPLVVIEGLILSTRAPYLDFMPNGGIKLNPNGANGKMQNFPISINQFEVFKQGESGLRLTVGLGLNLIGSDDGGFSGDGSFSILGDLIEDGNGVQRWVYNKFIFHGASVEINVGPLKAKGSIYTFDDHPTYGDGFYGTLYVGILGDSNGNNPKFELELAAMFGKNQGYRYFMFDGYVGGDIVKVPLYPPALYLTGFGGGVFYHMKPAGYIDPETTPPNVPTAIDQGELPDTAGLPPGAATDLTGIVYEPTTETKLGLKFTVGFSANANAIVGKFSVFIRFGPNMGLQNITFWGVADFFKGVAGSASNTEIPNIEGDVGNAAKSQDEVRAQNEATVNATAQEPEKDVMRAKVGLSLDFDQGFSIHGYAELLISMPDVGLVGSGAVDLLIDPANDDWHLFIGGYNDGSVTVPAFFGESEVILHPVHAGITYNDNFEISADLYFLLGTNIPGPPPIHPGAAAFFGIDEEEQSADGNNRQGLSCGNRSPASATGIAFGAAAFFKIEFDKGARFCLFRVRVSASGGVGFDVSLLKYKSGVECSTGAEPKNPDKPQGIKGFRMTGRIWAFVSIDGGKVFCIPLPKIGIGAKIEADLINPSFFDMRVYVKFFSKKVDFGLKIGKRCGVMCESVD